jgi:hypothetical protein
MIEDLETPDPELRIDAATEALYVHLRALVLKEHFDMDEIFAAMCEAVAECVRRRPARAQHVRNMLADLCGADVRRVP